VNAHARLAWSAAARGDAERAGMLWGAIEAEEARRPLDVWRAMRPVYERAVASAAGLDFEPACAAGRLLTLDEAVEYALTNDD
jgi:hypothetical protein